MSWFKSVLNLVGTAAGWMEKNPTAASILGGAVAGGAQYYANKQSLEAQEAHDEKMYQRRKSDQLENSKASSGVEASGYGNFSSSLTGGTGLLTNGKFVKK